MADDNGLTYADLLRDAPVQTLLLTAVPVGLAAAQLFNGLYTEFPLWAAVTFAAVMLASTVLLAQHHQAELRVTRLEREPFAPRAD